MKFKARSFAPPLTDETIAEYRKVLATIGPCVERDSARAVTAPTELWWGMPESRELAGPELKVSVAYWRQAAVQDVPLEEVQVIELDPVLPALQECPAHGARFAPIQLDHANRNGERLQCWREQIDRALFSQHFAIPFEVFQEQSKRLKTVSKAVPADKLGDVMRVLFPGFDLDDFIRRRTAWRAAFNHSLDSREYPIPRPNLEDTRLRDAAYTMLWHSTELALDREPTTTDKLRVLAEKPVDHSEAG